MLCAVSGQGAGMKEMKEMKEHRSPAAAPAVRYLLLHFSRCDDIRSKEPGRTSFTAAGFIADKSECQDAAVKLGLIENSETRPPLRDSYSTYDPTGCILIGGYGGRYDLKWNANVYSRKKCSSLEQCVCRVKGQGNQTSDDFKWWQNFEKSGSNEPIYFSWFLPVVFFMACTMLMGYFLRIRRDRRRTTRRMIAQRARQHRRISEMEERRRSIEMVEVGVQRSAPDVPGPNNPYVVRPSPDRHVGRPVILATVTAIPIYSDDPAAFSRTDHHPTVVYANAEVVPTFDGEQEAEMVTL